MDVLSSGFLSAGVRYQVVISGDVGSREIENLITILNVMMGWFAEDEEQRAAINPPSVEPA